MTTNALDGIPENQLSLADKKNHIAHHSLFGLLSDKHLESLASIAKEIHVPVTTHITNEGSIVDSIFLIAAGTAEVTRTVRTVEKSEIMRIATLNENNAIGIGESGLYSQTGIRTATVTATSPMVLLKIPLREFQEFLNQPGVTYPGLKHAVENILLMNFIQTTHVFKDFTSRQIQSLTNHIKKVTLPAGTIVFTEGDKIDNCYYILSGKIALSSLNQPEKLLGYSEMVGDEIFNHSIRMTSASAKSECVLFILEKSLLPKRKKTIVPRFTNFINTLLTRLKNKGRDK